MKDFHAGCHPTPHINSSLARYTPRPHQQTNMAPKENSKQAAGRAKKEEVKQGKLAEVQRTKDKVVDADWDRGAKGEPD